LAADGLLLSLDRFTLFLERLLERLFGFYDGYRRLLGSG